MKKILLLLLSLIFFSCTGLFYQPDQHLYRNPNQLKINFKDVWFKSRDGTKLNGWYLKNSQKLCKPKGLVLFFHGNAQNISAHFVALSWLVEYGYDIFIPDYRGYGQSSGEASMEGIYEDSLAMLAKSWELFQQDHHKKFIIYGQSLGGIIAMRAHQDFSHNKEVDLLVLDSTFSSYQDVVQTIASKRWFTSILKPFVSLLINDSYRAKEYISKIQTPTLVIHSRDDEIIPFRNGVNIFKSLNVKKKWFWRLEKVSHINVFYKDEDKNRKRFLKLLNHLDVN